MAKGLQLPHRIERIHRMQFIGGVIVVLVGIIFWVFPPKKINGHYGYRTKASMKSQEAWDVAQKCSAKMMLVFGILCLVVDWMMLRMFPNLTFLHQYLYVQVPGMVVSFICMIIFTEFALRRVNK